MTLTLDIPDSLAADHAAEPSEEPKQSALAGLRTLAAAYSVSSKTLPISRDASDSPKSGKITPGAILLAQLRADGVLEGYGDASVDSPEMALRLRREVWRTREPE